MGQDKAKLIPRFLGCLEVINLFRVTTGSFPVESNRMKKTETRHGFVFLWLTGLGYQPLFVR